MRRKGYRKQCWRILHQTSPYPVGQLRQGASGRSFHRYRRSKSNDMKAPETKRRIASGELGPIKPAQGKRASTRATASQGPRSGGIANPWTARINDAYQKTVEAVFEIGRLLIQARDDLPHGEFQRMVARDLPFKARWARMY